MKSKNLPFLFLVLLFPFISIYGQQLIDENARWNTFQDAWFDPANNTYTYTIKLEGETLLDGQTYTRLHYSYDSLNTNWTPTDKYLRETADKKIYLKTTTGEERLIYDFSLEIGDTFNIVDNCNFIITDIYPITMTDGSERKRFNFDYIDIIGTTQTSFWIEGIGSPWGLINYEGAYCYTDHLTSLQCFYYDNDLVYQSPFHNICFTILPTQDVINSDEIKVFPNPTNALFQIESLNENWSMEEIQIYSTIGTLVKTISLNTSKTEIDITALSNGMYYLLIRLDNDLLVSRRIVKD